VVNETGARVNLTPGSGNTKRSSEQSKTRRDYLNYTEESAFIREVEGVPVQPVSSSDAPDSGSKRFPGPREPTNDVCKTEGFLCEVGVIQKPLRMYREQAWTGRRSVRYRP